MSQGKAPRPIKGGPPLWLWFIVVPITLLIVVGVVITSIPDDPEKLFDEAQAAFAQRDAREDFETALQKLKAFPDYKAHVALLEGMLATQQNHDLKAIKLLEEAAANETLKPEVLKAMGAAQVKLGKFQEAIENYEQAMVVSPSQSDEIRFSLARLYGTIGAFSLALDTLDQILTEDNSNNDARVARALVRQEIGQHEEAAADYAAILETPGDRAAASPSTIQSYGECLLRLQDSGRAQWYVEHCSDFLEDINVSTGISLLAGDIEAGKTRVEEVEVDESSQLPLIRFKARVQLAEDKVDDAAETILLAFTRHPRDKESFEIARRIFKKQGDSERLTVVEQNLQQFEQLEAEISASIEKAGDNIDNADVRFETAALYRQLGDYKLMQRWLFYAGQADNNRLQEITEVVESARQDKVDMFVKFPQQESVDKGKTEEPATEEPATEEPATEEQPSSAD